jgi:hypothetical protein
MIANLGTRHRPTFEATAPLPHWSQWNFAPEKPAIGDQVHRYRLFELSWMDFSRKSDSWGGKSALAPNPQ